MRERTGLTEFGFLEEIWIGEVRMKEMGRFDVV